MSGNSTIAKNTLFLYVRMAISMVVSFYTSRVLLQVLGVDDYGIYQAVGGIVGFLGFINGALGTGTSRYLTVSLGGGNMEKMKQMFSMAFYIHLGRSMELHLWEKFLSHAHNGIILNNKSVRTNFVQIREKSV